jgi:hypothetical protein
LKTFVDQNHIPDTVQFVDEIFAKYGPKTQPPAPAAAQPAPAQSATVPSAAPFEQPTAYNPAAQAFVPQAPAPAQDPWGNAQNSRKRTFHEGFQQDNQQGDTQRGGRSFKAPRTRRGGVGRGDRMNGRGRDVAPLPNQFQQGMPGFPPMPPGFPGFDQNDPMAALMALQSMGFPQMPGLPPMPVPGQPGADQAKSNEPCPFYETNGICYMGAACPYKHGQGPVTVPSGNDGELNLFLLRCLRANIEQSTILRMLPSSMYKARMARGVQTEDVAEDEVAVIVGVSRQEAEVDVQILRMLDPATTKRTPRLLSKTYLKINTKSK